MTLSHDLRPAPLVSSDVDITGLDGFMLNVQRLFASELWALSTGDEMKAALALWGRAWQQSPPGSVPNDERVLAAFSCAGKDWKKVKAMALRGFVECSDGRLYHRVLCEDVLNASRKRQAFRERTRNATEARRQRNEERDAPRNDQRNVVVEANVTSVQGQGQFQGQKKEAFSLRSKDAGASLAQEGSIEKPMSRSSRPRKHVYPADAFERWYADYPNKIGRGAAEKSFAKVRESDSVAFETLCAAVARYRKTKPVDREWCNPATWLNQARWTDEPASTFGPQAPSRDGYAAPIDFGNGCSAPPETIRKVWSSGQWPSDWGARPDQPGCRIPPEAMAAIMSERAA
jgi:uncharacterized protein YdaU (DUF1376 family)